MELVFLNIWDESMRHGVESKWIVATWSLYHLQYPIVYLSRLYRILCIVRLKLHYKAAPYGLFAAVASPTALAMGD